MNPYMVELLLQANEAAEQRENYRRLFNAVAANIADGLKSLVGDELLDEQDEVELQIAKALQTLVADVAYGISETNLLLRALLNGFLTGWPSKDEIGPPGLDPFTALQEFLEDQACSQPAPERGEPVEVG